MCDERFGRLDYATPLYTLQQVCEGPGRWDLECSVAAYGIRGLDEETL
jgi:hypothetical protein